MFIDELVQELTKIKSPEVLETLKLSHSVSFAFHSLVENVPVLKKLYEKDWREAYDVFLIALSVIKKEQYPNMDEEEIAFCFCLKNCKDIDYYEKLKHYLIPDQIEKILSIHNKYHNDLTSAMLRSVLTERTIEWYSMLKEDIANALNKDSRDIILVDYWGDYETTKGDEEGETLYRIYSNFTIDGIECDSDFKTNFIYDDTWNYGYIDIVTTKDEDKNKNIISVMVEEKYYIQKALEEQKENTHTGPSL